MSSLIRMVLRLEPVCQERVDDLADQASDALQQHVSRSAVIRTAVEDWLARNEGVAVTEIIEAIRDHIVKRGRRRKEDAARRIQFPEEAPPKKRFRRRGRFRE